MNIRQKLSADDMRERIITVAEEHFRRIGYAKTAVADIAGAMGMSPANVYRFFPSKLAINDAICAKLMQEIDALMGAIVEGPGSAGERLTALFRKLHSYNKARLTDEHRLFDMVEVAMAENWPAIEAHCQSVVSAIARVVGDGVRSGEFRAVDAAEFAQSAFEASSKIFHPTMIAQCAHLDQNLHVGRITALVLAALRP